MAEQTKAPKLVKLDIVEHEKFNSIITTNTLTSNDLEKKVSDLFSPVFADFEGCKIVAGQQQDLKCKLYFKPCMAKNDTDLYAVKVRGEMLQNKPQNSYGLRSMVSTVNMLHSSKEFDLEDTAKEILSEFILTPDVKFVDRYDETLGKVIKVRMPKNFGPFVSEESDQVANTRFQNVYLVVTLDLRMLVSKMYGKKDESEIRTDENGKTFLPKDKYQYAVNVVKYLNATTMSYILEIKRIDIVEMNKLSNSIGYGTMTGSIIMTRHH